MNITIIGAKGFIGGHLVKKLKEMNMEVFLPERGDPKLFTAPLGHVIYCAGVTSDFRRRPFDTINAHVSVLSDFLQYAEFESLLYLSSTRVYYEQRSGDEEADIKVNPGRTDDLFNLSKLMGESLCLNSVKPKVRIARISNVVGRDFESDNFLYSVIKDAVDKQAILLQTAYSSSKDYICIEDVVELLVQIALKGQGKIYNVASGFNIPHSEIVKAIELETSCAVQELPLAEEVRFPQINIERIKNEFGFEPMDIIERVRELVQFYTLAQRG